MGRFRYSPASIAVAACLAASGLCPSRALSMGVVINEIHYAPLEGPKMEFVELFNPSPSEVSIAGFRIEGGFRFVFPDQATVSGLGYVVVARDPSALLSHYQLSADSEHIFGPCYSARGEGTRRVVLVDGSGSVVEEVEYEDNYPWDRGADGRGGSLERTCAGALPELPYNWHADLSGPTPLGPSHLVRCPPVPPPMPPVTINEIHYHPVSDTDARAEFVELENNTDAAIDLDGWSFDRGIQFTFPASSWIPAHGFAVVARNQAVARDLFGIEGPLFGDFQGQLDNSGERLTLFNTLGQPVDTVRYSDHGNWPAAADGMGTSLERISSRFPGDDPSSWSASKSADADFDWKSFGVTGVATSSTIYLYIVNAGEVLVDDMVLESTANPGVNLLANGNFDSGLDGWVPAGNHLDTTWQTSGGTGDSGALRVVANGRGSGPVNGITGVVDPPLVLNAPYRLSLRYRHVSGSGELLVRVSGASLSRGMFIDVRKRPPVTAGAPNSAQADCLPPFLSQPGRSPREPGSTDSTTITARVRGSGASEVTLTYWLNFKPDPVGEVRMLDDGVHGDGENGDGLHGAELPPFPHNTAVTFRIRALDPSGCARDLPQPGDPSGTLGYYVSDDRPDSPLPVFHILLDHLSVTPSVNILRTLNCSTWRAAAFAIGGELYTGIAIRQRGQSVCGSTKPFLKLRFAKGRDFVGRHKVNLQSIWTDKALIREHLAWEMFHELQSPYCTTRYVRLHVNGTYFGLYSELEHPDADFLARNGLNPQGNLYKAVASREEQMPNYQSGYEKKTNENGDYSDLKTFLDAMNTTPATQLRSFWERSVVPDSLIDYQATQVLTNNRDYPHKNHYLYHDTEDGKWRTISWDMDLTFGKYWDGGFQGVLNDRMDNPGITPWYTTRVAGEGIGNYLLDRFFFATPDRYYQRALRVRLWIALKEKYSVAIFDRKIDVLRDLLLEEQAEDMKKWGRSPASGNDPTAPRDFEPNIQRVRTHIGGRQTYLINYLKNTDRLPAPDQVKFTEVMYHPPGDGQNLEFIELYNNSARDIDISGWSIQGVEYQFPPGSTLIDGEVFVVARSPQAFEAIHGPGIRVFGPYPGELDDRGEELRVKDAGPGYPATIDAVRYSSGPPWSGLADGLGHSLELTEVSADRDNDPPENWRASAVNGGTPGRIPGRGAGIPFRRGDCSGDSTVNIFDAITMLAVIFYDQPVYKCFDGCDANGDRAVDISDVLTVLGYLFLRQNSIPEPGPRSCSPLEGSFCAETNCAPPP